MKDGTWVLLMLKGAETEKYTEETDKEWRVSGEHNSAELWGKGDVPLMKKGVGCSVSGPEKFK